MRRRRRRRKRMMMMMMMMMMIIIIIIIIIIINNRQFSKLRSGAGNSLFYDKRPVGFLRRLQISEMLIPR